MALSVGNLKSNFIIGNRAGTYSVIDLTNYAAAGVAASDVAIYLKIDIDSGSGLSNIYNNIGGSSPDIQPSVGTVSVNTIPVIVDGNGRPVQGTYYVTALYIVTGTSNYNVQGNYSYALNPAIFTYPEIDINIRINCNASTITSTDLTDYGSYVELARTHTLYPPPGSKFQDGTLAQPKVTTLAINVFGPEFFTGRWNSTVDSNVTWLISPNFYLIDNIEDCVTPDAVCDVNLCEIMCCVQDKYKAYEDLTKINPVEAAEKGKTVGPMLNNMLLYWASLGCGNETKTAYYRNQVLLYSGCSGCGTPKDCPQIVIPLTQGAGQFFIDSPNNTLRITFDVVGDLTTFHIVINPAIITQLNNLHNTIVQNLDDSCSVVLSAGPNGEFIYTISVPVTPIQLSTILEVRWVISPSGATWIATPTYLLKQGTNLADPVAPNTYDFFLGSNEPTNPAGTDFIVLRFSNFLTAPKNFDVQCQLMNSNPGQNVDTIKNYFAGSAKMEAEVLWVPDAAGNDVYIRIKSSFDGHAIQFSELTAPNTQLILGMQIVAEV